MITKEQFEKLYDPENITKKDYDKILSLIDERFAEICEHFLHKANFNAWYDYSNVSYGKHGSDGFFDPDLYKDMIWVGGEYIEPPLGFDLAFPTKWLWEEDWKEQLQREIEIFEQKEQERKEKAKKSAETRKKKREALKKSVREKLTDEEMKIIKFK